MGRMGILRPVLTDITGLTPMPALLMGIMGRRGLRAVCLSAQAPGITTVIVATAIAAAFTGTRSMGILDMAMDGRVMLAGLVRMVADMPSFMADSLVEATGLAAASMAAVSMAVATGKFSFCQLMA